jgi:hypothetical protein
LKTNKRVGRKNERQIWMQKNLSTWISALHCAFYQIVIKNCIRFVIIKYTIPIGLDILIENKQKKRKRNERQILMQKLANFNFSMILLSPCLPIVIRQNLLGML